MFELAGSTVMLARQSTASQTHHSRRAPCSTTSTSTDLSGWSTSAGRSKLQASSSSAGSAEKTNQQVNTSTHIRIVLQRCRDRKPFLHSLLLYFLFQSSLFLFPSSCLANSSLTQLVLRVKHWSRTVLRHLMCCTMTDGVTYKIGLLQGFHKQKLLKEAH